MRGALPVRSERAPTADESGRIARLLSGRQRLVVVASFFGFACCSLTPCVFPMIPILSRGHHRRYWRAGRGKASRTLAASPLARLRAGHVVTSPQPASRPVSVERCCRRVCRTPGYWRFCADLRRPVAFDVRLLAELQLPSFMQSRLSEEATHLKGGSLAAVTLMGALSG